MTRKEELHIIMAKLKQDIKKYATALCNNNHYFYDNLKEVMEDFEKYTNELKNDRHK